MESYSEKVYSRFSMFQQRGPDVSRFRQILNLVGCIIVLPIYSIITAYTRHPLTLDVLLTIFAAEYNRFTNENRRRQLQGPLRTVQDPEKASSLSADIDRATECMAAIVGYREDPELFARALDSYKLAAGCRFVLVGVDGDEVPDMEMVRVFQHVRTCNRISVHIELIIKNRSSPTTQPSFKSMSLLAKSPCGHSRKRRLLMGTCKLQRLI